MKWSKRIKQLRENKNITQEQLATFLGITQKTVSRIENNESQPTNATQRRIKRLEGTLPLYEIELRGQDCDNMMFDVLDLRLFGGDLERLTVPKGTTVERFFQLLGELYQE